jgi:ABC-type proline/glycine betaine transport system ATPase subunit
MAEKKGKSKTDVSARAEAKSKSSTCSICGKKIEVVMSVSASGKRKMKRLCCEN